MNQKRFDNKSNQIGIRFAAGILPLRCVMAIAGGHWMRSGRFGRSCRMNQISVRIFSIAQIAAADAAVALAAVERATRLAYAAATNTKRIGLNTVVIQRPGGGCDGGHFFDKVSMFVASVPAKQNARPSPRECQH